MQRNYLLILIMLFAFGWNTKAQEKHQINNYVKSSLDDNWSDEFPGPPGIDGTIHAVVKDGNGHIYVAGIITAADNTAVARIAKWDGNEWSALGEGLDGQPEAMAVDSENNIYVVGFFTRTGDGLLVNRIAKWDGSSWSALGTGADATVYGITIDNHDNVYVAGQFTTVGGVSANRIAKWDGSSWSAIGDGFNNTANTVLVDDAGNIYAGGHFTEAEGASANSIAKWNGTNWSALGSGTDALVRALCLDNDGNLFVGGHFSTAGGIPANRLAKWDGTDWSALFSVGMSEIGDFVTSIKKDNDGNIYVGGNFTNVDDKTINRFAKWNGSEWSSLGTGFNGRIFDIFIDQDDNIYAGGVFSNADSKRARSIARWDGNTWYVIGNNGFNDYINSVVVDNNGNIYVGGNFSIVNQIRANRIAKWDGTSWSALGQGVSNTITDMAFDSNGNLYVVGLFTHAGDIEVNRIAKWDGNNWGAVGAGFSATLNSITIDNNDNVFVGGQFTTEGIVEFNRIAKWNGIEWSKLGDGVDHWVISLDVDGDGNVYAGGHFTQASGITANRIAKWNGTAWSALDNGLNNSVYAIKVHDNGTVYVGGNFTQDANEIPMDLIAKWDGTSFSAMGTGFQEGSVKTVRDIDIDENGKIYAVGTFLKAGIIEVNRIAMWDSEQWNALGSGLDNSASGIRVVDNIIYCGGLFINAGGKPSAYFAKYTIPVPPTVTTATVTNIEGTTATANGSIIELGSSNPTQHGFCWNTTGDPTVEDSMSELGVATVTGVFSSSLTGLDECTTYYVKAYATNIAGTSYGDEVVFTTLDISPPEITSLHADQVIGDGIICQVALPDYRGDVIATDNCTNPDVLVITQTPVAGTIISGGENQVTLRVTDEADNFAEVSFNVSVEDNTNPVITSTHEAQTVSADEDCQAALPDYTGDVTATDNCTDPAVLVITQTPVAGTIISGVENQVTLRVTDEADNFAEVSFNVSVEDDTNPVITSTHEAQTVSADEDCQAALPDYTGDVTATDNCTDPAVLVITQTPVAGTIISGGENQVTLRVTDEAGNFAEVSFNVSVDDDTDPVITSTHEAQTVSANENCLAALPDYTGDLTATDNCTDPNDLIITQTPEAETIISGSTNQVTLRVTDEAGNYAEVSFNVSVEDNTAPVITSTHEAQTVLADEDCQSVLPDYTGDVTATDNCTNPDDLVITQTPVAGTIISGDENEVTLRVTDEIGNFAEVTFNVEVIDNTSPVITSNHPDQNYGNGFTCSIYITSFTSQVIATDNCTVAEELIITQTPPPAVYSGPFTQYTTTLRVEDLAGNYDEVSFLVTIVDNIKPEITSEHEDQTLNAGENCQTALPDYTVDITATDNCSDFEDLVITQTPAAGTLISGSENEVTLRVTDQRGIFEEVSFNVSVEDNTAPVITSTHEAQTVSLDDDCQAVLPDYTGSVTATDNCTDPDDLIITQTPEAGTTISGSVNEVILRVTDDAGNFTEVSFNVSVEDNTAPVITSTHEAQTVSLDDDCQAVLPDYTGSVTATDNCTDPDDLIIAQTPEAGTTISGSVNEVILRVTDDAGNFTEVNFNVSVEDDTDPTIACIENQTIDLSAGESSYIVEGTEFDPVSVDDNCGVASLENDFNNTATLNGAELLVGTTTIVWIVTDNSGNTESCSFDITLNDYVAIADLQTKGISIYPNPTNGFINFDFTGNDVQNILVSNMAGRILIEKPVNSQFETIDLSEYPDGVYLIVIKAKNQIYRTKILKQ